MTDGSGGGGGGSSLTESYDSVNVQRCTIVVGRKGALFKSAGTKARMLT